MECTPCPEDRRDDRSEASAAVVSLYNSWSGCASDGEESLVTPYDSAADRRDHICHMTERELLQELRRRCRPQDVPGRVPALRARRKPVCLFVNFLGGPGLHSPTISTPPASLSAPAALVSEPSSPASVLDMYYGDDYVDVMKDFPHVFGDDGDDDDNDGIDLFDAVVHVRKRPRLADSPLSFSDESADYSF